MADVLQSGKWSADRPVEPLAESTFPNPSLAAVSCSSSTSCEAVGSDGINGGTSLAEHWNGTKWAIQSPEEVGKSLDAVDCVSETFCEAVGTTNKAEVFAELWNGTEWKLQTIPSPEGAKSSGASGVSCTSTVHCEMTGSYVNSSGTGQTLAELWNGTEWKVQKTPNPAEDEFAGFSGVSCSSGAECEAVGRADIAKVETVFAERWNGTEWKLQAIPSPTGATRTLLGSVSCPSSSMCEATGDYNTSAGVDTALAERWNGTEWSIQSIPSPEGVNNIRLNVSCATSVSCYAAGDYGTTTNQVALVEKWNGTEWATQTVPNATETVSSTLQDVACKMETECKAFGNFVNGNNLRLLFAESFVTRWGSDTLFINNDQYAGTKTNNSFQGISCIVKSICLGVGYDVTSSGAETATADVEESLGRFTKKNPPIPAGAKASNLQDVSCPVEELLCEGVGSYKNSSGTTTLYAVGPEVVKEVTVGWQLQAPPSPEGAKASSLLGVSCATGESCEAVGEYTSSAGVETPLAEHWNGSKWTLQTAAVPTGAKASSLLRAFCTSSTSCEAIGSYKNSSGTQVVLAELWNGTKWAVQTTTVPLGAKASVLRGISCVGGSYCAAVGSYTDSAGVEEILEEGWNGTKWEFHGIPNPEGAKASVLRGVSCVSSTYCEAVGDFVNSSGVEEALTETGS
jgi:hypothetical protein